MSESENTGLVVEEVPEEEAEEKKEPLDLAIESKDAGPCKKHVSVTIVRKDIERYYDDQFGEMMQTAAVPGFRPGKTPRKLLEKRFRKEIGDQVKGQLVYDSYTQLVEDKKLDPLSEPELKLDAITLPDEGDMKFEFEVEVRPTFDLPDYKGLEVERPVRDITDLDVDKSIETLRDQLGTTEEKGGPAAAGDWVVVDVRVTHDGAVVSENQGLRVRLKPELLFRDGKIDGFGEKMTGVKPGDSRDLKVAISGQAANAAVAGKELDAVFVVHEVLKTTPAENDALFNALDVGDMGELRDWTRENLTRRLAHEQLQSARTQVTAALIKDAKFELPKDLLRRQASNALQRRIVELSEAGYSEDELKVHANRLTASVLSSTEVSLKQQFILDEIAEREKIEIGEEDLDEEIESIAVRSGESPRRVRARIEKDGLMSALGANLMERKTIDKVLSYAKMKDVSAKAAVDDDAATVDTIAAPAEEAPAEAPAEEAKAD
ncbi:MAG TPA: trigger factor [Planctomycetia bacterium]|nr:trigger factor [Planctomycetia bacterium]